MTSRGLPRSESLERSTVPPAESAFPGQARTQSRHRELRAFGCPPPEKNVPRPSPRSRPRPVPIRYIFPPYTSLNANFSSGNLSGRFFSLSTWSGESTGDIVSDFFPTRMTVMTVFSAGMPKISLTMSGL